MKILDETGQVAIGGSPGRVGNSQPTVSGVTGGGRVQTTRYDRNIVNLGPPTSVIDVSDFPQNSLALNFVVGVADFVALTQNAQPRRMLCMQNAPISPAGSYLYINFGNNASSLACWFAIPVGGIILLDAVVPQDDVHIAGSVAGVNAIIAYNTYPIPQQQTQAR